MTPMKHLLALTALALCAALPAWAQQKLLPAQSEVAFTSKQMGVPVDGKFRRFDAQLAFDPKKPEAARMAFTVDLASVSMGAAESEAEVVKPEWFNTQAFAQATFVSSSVKALGAGKFEVAGTLAIKGTRRDVRVPVQLSQTGGLSTATGSFVLKRLDYRIGEGDWKDTSMVADEVLVKFKLTLSGVGPM